MGSFAVLKTPGIPSVLIETTYLTNKHDAQLLKSDKFLDEFATGIYKAIESYFFNYRNVVFGK
jgi:N-acetylmuramoyl-L-alanine amidase